MDSQASTAGLVMSGPLYQRWNAWPRTCANGRSGVPVPGGHGSWLAL